jgi:hypothetical protein
MNSALSGNVRHFLQLHRLFPFSYSHHPIPSESLSRAAGGEPDGGKGNDDVQHESEITFHGLKPSLDCLSENEKGYKVILLEILLGRLNLANYVAYTLGYILKCAS